MTVRTTIALTLAALAAAAVPAAEEPSWPWGPEHDAVAAAPDSHLVMLENERVRVLDVVIRPGEKEPPHTHPWPSVMLVVEPARIRYYDADGDLRFETPARPASAPPADPPTSDLSPDWLGPEPLHAVENIDTRRFRAVRIELKPAPSDGE